MSAGAGHPRKGLWGRLERWLFHPRVTRVFTPCPHWPPTPARGGSGSSGLVFLRSPLGGPRHSWVQHGGRRGAATAPCLSYLPSWLYLGH